MSELPSPPPSVQTLLRHLGAGLRVALVRRSVATPPRLPLADTDLASKSFVHLVVILPVEREFFVLARLSKDCAET